MNALCETLRAIRAADSAKRISFVSGNFQVIHSGHVRLLRFAREMADMLVVGVLPRNDFNAVVSEEDRLENVRSLSVVDHTCLLQGDIGEAIQALRPDFVVKGKEHEDSDNPEAAVLEASGGKLIFAAGAVFWSESDMIAHEATRLPLRYPHAYMQRRGISLRRLEDLLHVLRGLRVIVVGDTIVDEYVHCDPLGMSQEDPTLVVQAADASRYLGGAGIVAAHAAGLGARARFATICGQDAAVDFVRARLADYGVEEHIFIDGTRPTSLKQRFRCRGKTLLRVSHLRQHAIDRALVGQLLDALSPLLDDTDVLVFSDFNYGCLAQPLVEALTRIALEKNVFIMADSQSSSQVGDVSRFRNAGLLTPTEREARLAVHDFESGLVVLADKLLEKASARNVLMTLGEAGLFIQRGGADADQLPAFNQEAKDVAGAGDSLLIAAGLALAAGEDVWHAACLGSLAAAVQVSREGNIPLTAGEIAACMRAWR